MTERTFWRRYRRNRAAVLGLALFALVVFTAIFGWLLYPSDPWAPVTRPFRGPVNGRRFPWARTPWGATCWNHAYVSLLIGLAATGGRRAPA
jgi:peptide/nickel transport system permease protein